jgi:ABC-type multidrug transport system ATPase subunit
LITLIGLAFGFELFLNIDFPVLFFTFFFFSLAMNGLAYFLSAFLHTSAAALWVGVCSFFVGFILYVVVGAFGVPWGVWPGGENFYMNCSANALFDPQTKMLEPLIPSADSTGKRFVYLKCAEVPPENSNYSRQIMYHPDGKEALAPILSLYPPTLLTKTLSDLGSMASNDTGAFGMGLHNVTSYCFHNTTEGTICDKDYAVGNVWGIWFGLYVMYSLFGLYLDNVLSNNMGVRKPWNYFMLPSYWNFEQASLSSAEPEVLEASIDDDVLREEGAIKARIGAEMLPENAIEVRGIRRTWKRNVPMKGMVDFHAVKCPWFGIQKKSLYALLGPNGAGKTTLINILTGVLPASCGEALIENQSVTHPSGMAQIRALLGVCPQFDILWGHLTAMEHLQIFSAIKGLPQQTVEPQCIKLLEEVRLADVAHKLAGTFSGGMKRRLSVAIALVGNPSVLFLDEPTTGMDPISRRHVWDVIEKAKQDRAVVLTTHSMEEADVLGDRVGIMAKGMLRCIGSPTHLKNKFGSGYKLTISLAPNATAENTAAIRTVFAQVLQSPAKEETSFFLSYSVPTRDVDKLPQVFNHLEGRSKELGIENIQIASSSLEDVFLNISKSVGAKDGSNGLVQVKTCTNETVMVQPGTDHPFWTPLGHQVRVLWSMDSDGNFTVVDTLCLASVVSLGITVPAERGPGASVEVEHEGRKYQVVVPANAEAGSTFVGQIQVPTGPASVEFDVGEQENSRQLARDKRVQALASSYLSQTKAMFTKTRALQMKRFKTNVCLCACPGISLLIIFVVQIVIQGLYITDKMASMRCTYCGPKDDSFGKEYCAGMECWEYFWQTENQKANSCQGGGGGANRPKCLATMDVTEVNEAKAYCEDISKTCGGKGNYSCFWPDAAKNNGSLGGQCTAFSSGTVFSVSKPLSFAFSPRNAGLLRVCACVCVRVRACACVCVNI